jgi:hypothetical protein
MVVASSIAVSFAPVLTAYAAPVDGANPEQEAKALLYYRVLAGCFRVDGDPDRPTGNLSSGSWFAGHTVDVGYVLNSSDGKASCDDKGMVSNAASALGYSDPKTAWCDLMKYANVVANCPSADPGTTDGDRQNSFKQAAEEKYWGSRGDPANRLSQQAQYWLYLNTFLTGCKVAKVTDGSTGQYTVKTVNSSGVIEDTVYKSTENGQTITGPDGDTSTGGIGPDTRVVAYEGFSPTCSELAQWTSNAAQGFADYAKRTGYAIPTTDGVAAGNTSTNGSGTTTCGIKTAIGWILCPVTNFLAVMLDKMYEFISSKFLVVPSALFDSSNGTYKSWKIFRDYANVAFIIAFLIIVYSQVTSVGISNYGIKKLLPKLIIAAVLVNISYYICQGLVELTNLLGYGIKSMFDGVSTAVLSTPGGGNADTGEGGTVAGVITTALAGTAVVVIAVALGLIIPAIVAVGIVFIILLIRQALIVILIVLSPLAFVAWLLPNTEGLFKKWWGMLINTLMVFPIIAFLFGGAKLASVVLASTDDSNITQLIAVGVATVPLFMVLPLLNKAVKDLPVLGKRLQNMGDKATGRIGKKASAKSREKWQNSYLNRNLAERKKIRATRQAMIAGGTYSGHNPVSRMRSAVSGRLNQSAITGRAGDRMATMGEALEDKEFEESVSAAAASQKGMLNSQVEAIALGQAGGSEAEQVAAARQIMKDGNHEQRMAMLASSGNRKSDKVKQSIRDGAYAKGMSSYLGGGVGDAIMNGSVTSQADLDNMIAQTAESGKLTADGMVADGSAANRIHAVLQAAKSGADQAIDTGKKDASGNAIMHVVSSSAVSSKVTAKGIAYAKKAASDAQQLPATKGRIAGNMRDSITNMSNF